MTISSKTIKQYRLTNEQLVTYCRIQNRHWRLRGQTIHQCRKCTNPLLKEIIRCNSGKKLTRRIKAEDI